MVLSRIGNSADGVTNMHTIKIDLPETHTAMKGPRDKSWEAVSVSIDVTKLSPDIIARLATHGLHQKLADAASQSKTADEALAAMNKAADSLLAGEWATRRGGEGVDEFTRIARLVVRRAIKAKLGGASPEWKAFTGLADDEQAAKLDANFAKNEAVFRPEVEAEIARRAAEAKARTGLAAKVAFDI